ncbi:Protein of uncharacterised function (DUF1329) [Streptococcus pneumoniae]|uniref:DUF1329 domain-containing protein n=1 Tax=Stutzerimonas stutzeri TaxID=316 RepID=A0AA40RWS1_STUST|nr:DUF1329 domain-containing protein [Stutzerimonas stutzeri]CJK99855.1 Protein of uncharacterised function (DUF1329) [Streptococcus pneumoniae]MBA1306894.1 DUF1329 domain-containing protein [Stutzerimonas stutzeri]MDH0610715.1 DUF1329 domain-containing protein [Stutzerimonas stutzeri]RRV46022.1 DUF1329 domain-containing protein [Stutzerimonas stutzeri]RRV52460.1 DUF1329 domain-containing protein [Stutzerimonas stutzeri]
MKKTGKLLSVLAFSLLASSVMAAVSPEEAAKLGTSLTPLGAEKAGNAGGTIPEWAGGLKTDAAPLKNGHLTNPFKDEQPKFVITAQNAEQYKDKLTAGQLAMFKRYPETYKIRVFPTHRTVAVPDEIYEAAKKSAVNTELVEGGNGLANFTDSRYYAFPIPKNGLEVVWNHITRYRGGNVRRNIVQATPQTNGSYTMVHFEDEVAFPLGMTDLDPERAKNALLFFKQRVTAPSRLAGNVLLVHDSLDQVKEPRQAWIYNAGQRRVRRAPQVAYDGPGTASDGMRTTDNFDMFSGAPDRYDWKLIGKKELYIPYNSYEIASSDLKYKDIIKAGHVNQDLARYELHRVWEIEATLKSGERNIYAKRRFFVDEDSWTIVQSELYDGRGQLWRVGEAHSLQYYQHKVPAYAFEALYDIISGRYIAIGMSNEEKPHEYGYRASARDFTPAALRNAGVR